ncbi:hypothetical protein KBX50_08350 [Micromonospora sp. C51]|uniref:hypothetical protein n=1 Tax=Micromonospora sp. C51 TaxID=2824879 RepID=UPI001B36171D|nr:hypothetical protein [Micromonospora sp. C51]MBQ1048474.1 hypothetical protein [Micromonospora sp. C51]
MAAIGGFKGQDHSHELQVCLAPGDRKPWTPAPTSTYDPQAAFQLGEHMSAISEDVYSASWIQGNEWTLWRALLDWRATGRALWDPKQPAFGDITEYMPRLDELKREAHGWVWWLNGRRQWVPIARWEQLVAAREQAHLSNDQLDEQLPGRNEPADTYLENR